MTKRKMRLDEVSILTGYHMQTVYALARQKGFPEPAEVMGTIKLYDRAAMMKWIKANEAKRAKRKAA